MAHDVFISYSVKDRKTADAICHTLEENNIRCWYAPRDIRSGTSWTAAIMNGIADSRVMILVWSSSSNASPDVTREVHHAFRKNVAVIPFRIEDIAPTKEMEYYLEAVQSLDASTLPLEDNLQRLVEHIRPYLPTDNQVSDSEEELSTAKAEAQREVEEEEARERAAEEARVRAAEEAERLDQSKRLEEQARVEREEEARQKSLEEAARLRAEDERQRDEAEARAVQIALGESQRRKKEETGELNEDQTADDIPAVEMPEQSKPSPQPVQVGPRTNQQLVSLDSDSLPSTKKFPIWLIAIPVLLLLIVGSLIYFWLQPDPQPNEPSATAAATNANLASPPVPSPSEMHQVEDPKPTPQRSPTSSPKPLSSPSPSEKNKAEDPKPTPTPKPSPTPALKPTAPIPGGVLNGKAISLPKPAYPAIAKSAHASGTVTVQVLIDENGSVVAAHATSGHSLLQAAAVQAARDAKFSPTRLSGQPVKVSGVITYHFAEP